MDQHNYHLPKYIIVLPDKDIIEAIKHYGFSCKSYSRKSFPGLAKMFKKSLDIRKSDMKKKKAGSILVDNQSKIIWIKMLQWPFIKHTDKGFVFSHRHTFNNVM